MRAPKPLTARFVDAVTECGVYSDGRGRFGLRLVVRPSTDPHAEPGAVRKSWTQRLTVNGRARHLGIGPYPLVTITKARTLALANARTAFDGDDPRAQGAPTFADAAQAVIALHRPNWKPGSHSEREWANSFDLYCSPLSDVPVDRITPADVVAVLEGPWSATKVTGRRVAHRVGAVMDWAIGQGWRSDNPVHVAVLALPSNGHTPAVHHPSIDHADAPRVMADVRRSSGNAAPRLCLEFVMLTAARSGEAREMVWAEIDADAAVWTVPSQRAKSRRSHRVPLSDAAMAVVSEARALSDGTGLVFPSARTGRPLTAKALIDVLRGVHPSASVHGMRATFRSWCADNHVVREVAEAALAHVVRGVEGAYQRSDMLIARRQVMADWSAHLHASA